jgi:hypothetical protein
MLRIPLSLAAFIACSSLAQAVSLANFIPFEQGLPTDCNTAYQAAIPGCVASDFESPYICSQACLNGLIQTNGQITTACKGVTVNPQTIIGLFLMGEGIQALCNVAVVTKTTGIAQTTTSVTVPSSSNSYNPIVVPASGMSLQPSPMSSPMTTITMIAPSSVTPSSAMAPATRSSSTLKTMTSSSSMKSTASAAAQQQNPSVPNCSNRGSTGSPFDSFTDQICEKISRASSKQLSPFAAVVGFVFAILLSQ